MFYLNVTATCILVKNIKLEHQLLNLPQRSRMVGQSDISGDNQLGAENSSPTSDRLSDVKFGTNLDVLAEITVAKTIIGKVTNHRTFGVVKFYLVW